MTVLWWIVFVISIPISAKIVNGIYKAFMSLIGADFMLFNGIKKIAFILVGAIIICTLIMYPIGLIFG